MVKDTNVSKAEPCEPQVLPGLDWSSWEWRDRIKMPGLLYFMGCVLWYAYLSVHSRGQWTPSLRVSLYFRDPRSFFDPSFVPENVMHQSNQSATPYGVSTYEGFPNVQARPQAIKTMHTVLRIAPHVYSTAK